MATASDTGEKGQNAVRELVAEDEKEVAADDQDIEVNGENKKASEVYIFPVTKQTLIFQLILMVVTCHFGMVMTNWGSPVIDGG